VIDLACLFGTVEQIDHLCIGHLGKVFVELADSAKTLWRKQNDNFDTVPAEAVTTSR
jgi:hypothetical protein